MKKTFILIPLSLALSLFTLFLSSCAAIVAHGPIVKQTKLVANFTRIEASNAFSIDYTSGSSASAVIEAPDDIIQLIQINENNGTLEISLTGNVNNVGHPIKIHLQSASLESVNLQGACEMELLSNLNGNNFQVDLSGASSFHGTIYMKEVTMNLKGASNAQLEGVTNKLTAEISGASTLDADKFSSANTNVEANGASNASVQADSSLDANATGASTISYKGNPVRLDKSSSGAGNVEKE